MHVLEFVVVKFRALAGRLKRANLWRAAKQVGQVATCAYLQPLSYPVIDTPRY
jgi:hypothetical protein